MPRRATTVRRSATSETADLLAPGEAERLIREASPDAVIHLAAIAVPFSAPEDVIFSTNTRLAYAVISAATIQASRSGRSKERAIAGL